MDIEAISLTELKTLDKNQVVTVNRVKVSSQLICLEQKKEDAQRAQILLNTLYQNQKANSGYHFKNVTIKVQDLLECFQGNMGMLSGEVYVKK